MIGDILLGRGHFVVLAAGEDSATCATRWRDLRPFEGHAGVTFADTRRHSSVGACALRAEELRALQDAHAAEATVFIEGDHWEVEFRRIGSGQAPRLRGRTVAIFGRTCAWYPGEDPYSGHSPSLSLRGVLAGMKRSLLHRRESEKYFFEHVLPCQRPVDVALVKDERVAERFGAPYRWMPEIYRVLQPREDERRLSDWDRFAQPIDDYVRRAGAANVALYFGTGAWYKGYDLFLRLAELDPSIYALHAGAPDRREAGKTMAYDTERIRSTLLREGRLFETQAYVESDDLVRLVYGGIERFVSTHRLTLSSGTMLQALELGRPVLTPDSGLVGYRTRKHGLGMTYRYFDDAHLAERWNAFRQRPVAEFQCAVEAFMARFSLEAVSRAIDEAICG